MVQGESLFSPDSLALPFGRFGRLVIIKHFDGVGSSTKWPNHRFQVMGYGSEVSALVLFLLTPETLKSPLSQFRELYALESQRVVKKMFL